MALGGLRVSQNTFAIKEFFGPAMIGQDRPRTFGASGGRAYQKLMTVSVIITTRNRATDLQRTCDVVMQLRPAPNEVLVTAMDVPTERLIWLADKFPEITLIANQTGIGSVCFARSDDTPGAR